ncbi:MAG: tRNA (adenosine(37)-N6)-dimethylallyltransferase MiaA [Leptonema sp. (in: bacteria)]
MKKLYAILGPTGSGKTNLLFQFLNQKEQKFEVINVDSRQVYKTIPIGTAIPSEEVIKKIPHHLINFLEPNKVFSAGEFKRKANQLIKEIYSRNHIPIFCGGSGFYFKAFSTKMLDIGEIRDEQKEEVRNYLSHLSIEQKREMLLKIDPLSLTKKNEIMGRGRFHPNDEYRIQRSLELYFLTKKTLRMHYEETMHEFQLEYKIIGIYLDLPFETLQKKLFLRSKEMVEQGIINEAMNLYLTYGDCNAMKTPGYREIIKLIFEKWKTLQISENQKNEVKDKIQEILYNTHKKYAKAQIKWFKKEKSLKRLNEEETKKFLIQLESLRDFE